MSAESGSSKNPRLTENPPADSQTKLLVATPDGSANASRNARQDKTNAPPMASSAQVDATRRQRHGTTAPTAEATNGNAGTSQRKSTRRGMVLKNPEKGKRKGHAGAFTP
jgi:hypothetical protein